MGFRHGPSSLVDVGGRHAGTREPWSGGQAGGARAFPSLWMTTRSPCVFLNAHAVRGSVRAGVVGVTDGDWYRYLAARPGLREVNFWRPRSKAVFRAL